MRPRGGPAAGGGRRTPATTAAAAAGTVTTALRTAAGLPVWRVGLGGAARAEQEAGLLPAALADVPAAEAGVVAFLYNPRRYPTFVAGVRRACAADRGRVCLCSGTPDRTAAGVEARVRDAVEITGGGRLDAFFAEYVTPGEDLAAVAGALAHARALGVPAVGATTHSVAVAADLLDLHEAGAAKLDVLMLRYSMAHANHHAAGTLARARALGVGLVGFCSTRWNGLLEGGGEGGGGNGAGGRAPTAAECVRWSLGGVELVVHSSRDEHERVAVMGAPREAAMSDAERAAWLAYGDAWRQAGGDADGFEADAA